MVGNHLHFSIFLNSHQSLYKLGASEVRSSLPGSSLLNNTVPSLPASTSTASSPLATLPFHYYQANSYQYSTQPYWYDDSSVPYQTENTVTVRIIKVDTIPRNPVLKLSAVNKGIRHVLYR